MKVLCSACLGFLVLAMMPPAAASQEQLVISGDQPGCQVCRLEFTEIGRIGGPSDTLGLISLDATRMQLIAGSEVMVRPALVPYVVGFYGVAGGEPRTIGREGGGPGEFRRISAVGMDSSGLIHVFADGRATVLSRSGAVVETREALTWRVEEVLFLPGGEFVLHGSVRTRERAGFPLHIVGIDGEVHRSFGKEGRGFEFDGYSFSRVLTPSDSERFWAANMNQYRAVEWDTAGIAHLEVRRTPTWFAPWETWTGPWEGRPPPRLADIREDSEGRIWTMIWVADEDFQPIRRDEADIRSTQGSGDHPLYDTIIEVLDLDTGELMLSQRFDRMFSGFHPGGIVAGWDATPAGHQLFVFYRVRIRRDGGEDAG